MSKTVELAEIEELIQIEIKHPMYYVGYPKDVPSGIWKDGVGKYNYICDMGLDHLKASIHKVERDIKRLEQSGRPNEVLDALMPKARLVLIQLKDEFKLKARL
jgi:hypothetical protein